MRWMVMPLLRVGDWSGRSRRLEFWMFNLLQWIVYGVLALLLNAVGGDIDAAFGAGKTPQPEAAKTVILIGWILTVTLVVPWLAVAVRRLHDQGRTGKWVLLLLVPIVQYGFIIFMFFDGEPHANRFGPDPRGRNFRGFGENVHPGHAADAPRPPRPPLG